jgi:hypothetical protein
MFFAAGPATRSGNSKHRTSQACEYSAIGFARRVAADRRVLGIGYPVRVSPTVLRVRGFRFYFFSREEPRAHVHVQHTDGEAKFWIEPTVELHANYGLKPKQIVEAEGLVEEHLNEIRAAWAKHFPG